MGSDVRILAQVVQLKFLLYTFYLVAPDLLTGRLALGLNSSQDIVTGNYPNKFSVI